MLGQGLGAQLGYYSKCTRNPLKGFEQTRNTKSGVKIERWTTEIWQKVQEFQKMTNEAVTSDEASTILETP